MPEAARQTGPALFPSGVVCDRFRIDGVLGVGGTGTVFRALDLEREEIVALKAIPHDATLRQRARREASVAGQAASPERRAPAQRARGRAVRLHRLRHRRGHGPGRRAAQGQLGDVALLRVASAVCAALAHAHEHGVVHRDVKPANVLLGRDGSVRVLDFGIAALDEPDATVDDRMLGTLSYMAPETCQGARPTPATDVWAVGVMVYEALTGANPFRARTPDELRERHKHPPRSLADLRPDLPRVARGACARALIAPAPAAERGRASRACSRLPPTPSSGPARASRHAGRGGVATQRRPQRRALHACPRCRRCPRLPRLPGLPAAEPPSSTLDSAAGPPRRPLRPRRAVRGRAARAARWRRAAPALASRSPPCSAPSRSGRPGSCSRSRARARRSRSRRPGSRPRSRSRSACPRSATSRPASPGARPWRAASGCSPACARPARAAARRSRRCSPRCRCGRSTCSPRAAAQPARPRAGRRGGPVRDRALGRRAARGRPGGQRRRGRRRAARR